MENVSNTASGGQEKLAEQDEILVPEEETRKVRDILLTLVKTKRAFEMYPSNNPILGKFQDELFHRFESFLGENGRLCLVIKQQDIYYKGRSVYHNAEKDDNLALLFYKDGLRELTFTDGLSTDELTDFLDVIRVRPETSAESFDDDIATLLWEKDFLHLSYFVVEEFIEGPTSEEEEEAGRMMERKTPDGEFVEAYEDAVQEEEKPREIFSPLESISMGFQGMFSLGEEEVKSLKEEMEALTDENFLVTAISALFESLYIDRGTRDFEVLMDNLDSALNYLIHNGGFATAALILRKFNELKADKETFTQKEADRFNSSITKAGSESRVKAIADVLNSGRDIDLEAMRQFMGFLGRSSIIPLSNLMAEIQDMKYRRYLIDVLVLLGRDNVDVLAAGLKDKRWFVVRNVAVILGRIGDKNALEHLRQALSHPEPRVRREIVRSLGMVGGPKAGEILLHAAQDQDPQIRMAALRYLPAAQSYSMIDNLIEMIMRPDFPDKTLPEKRVFFEVLAEVGQEHVMPYLLKTFKKKPFFSSTKTDELRVVAAYGLGNIHRNDAAEALKTEMPKAKKGTPLYDAISYSIQKLTAPNGAAGSAAGVM